MKRGSFILVLLFVFSGLINAQDYNNGIGIRAGFSSGLTFKHFQDKHVALEGLLTTRWWGFDFTGLYEIQNRAFDVDHLSWYYGAGGHVGFYNGDHTNWGNEGRSYTVVGVDGVLGLEYTFTEAPINIGIDWKPAINFFGYAGFWSEGAISVRYTF